MADNNDNILAILAHALGVILPAIPALIIWIIKKDESPYLRHHAAQALGFQITILIAYAVLTLTIFGIIFLGWAVGVFALVMAIIASIAAGKGDEYSYPSWCVIPFPFVKNA